MGHPLLLLDMAFPFGAERSARLRPRLRPILRLILRLGTMDIMDTVLDTMVDTMDILMDMDTMDILMDMGMDIMVDKRNNQNAKIGLERTPELSSSNYNQKINSTILFVQDQRMSKVHSKILQCLHIFHLCFFFFFC